MQRNEALKTWPSDIFLQAGEDYCPLDNYKEYSEITWAADGIGREDVRYVREDLHAALEAENAALREKLQSAEGRIITARINWEAAEQLAQNREEKIAALREKLAAAEARTVPDGWKLVPIEPTDAMDAAARAECHRLAGVIDPVVHVWDAMIAAAPILAASAEPAAQEDAKRQPSAWMTEDGRVVSDATMQGAINGGGAILSSMKPFNIAFYK